MEHFDKLKQILVNADTMVYYQQIAEKRVFVDALPFDLGAILTQKEP